MQKITKLLLAVFIIIFSTNKNLPAEIQFGNIQDNEDSKEVFFKIDQGITARTVSDLKMSNIHYSGFGGILNFGRRAHTVNYISEWSFLEGQFNYLKPAHENTQVLNPSFSINYTHLRDFNNLSVFRFYAGLQANSFADIRMAPRLGNSSVYADIIGELRPKAYLSTKFHLFRDWEINVTLASTVLGYSARIPEYGTIMRLTGDGGVTIQGIDHHFLHPFNFGHFTTGLFFRESFGDDSNPNWYQIGYKWDYYTLKGNYGFNVNNAVHRLVLELYFKVN